MPYFERSDIDGTWRIGITAEDLAWLASKRDSLASKLRGDQPAYIRYDLAHSAESYGDQPWVEMSLPGSHLRVPYVILHDYRTAPTNATWGTADVRGQFQFPSDLLDHRHAMVDRFKAEDRLPKGDSICPRVADFSRDVNGNPILSIERAWYTDQVGTNLTIDYPMRVPREMPRGICRTVREWDRAQGVDPHPERGPCQAFRPRNWRIQSVFPSVSRAGVGMGGSRCCNADVQRTLPSIVICGHRHSDSRCQ
jgi:hypothetical protein